MIEIDKATPPTRPPATPASRMGWPMRFAGFVALCLIAVALGAGGAIAEGWGYDLGSELMSPFCPGRTLSSCPSPQAAELIQWIVTQEAAGATREEVIEILIERFGEDILGAPPAKGLTLWLYILPVLGFLIFGAVAFLVLRRIVGGRQSLDEGLAGGMAARDGAAAAPALAHVGPDAGDAADADLAAIVDAELAQRG